MLPKLPVIRVPEKRNILSPCPVLYCLESSTNRAARSSATESRFPALVHCYLVPERGRIGAAPKLRDLSRFLRAVIICKLCTR